MDRVVCIVFAVENDSDRVDYERLCRSTSPHNRNGAASIKELPRDLGNEWGELVIKERKIQHQFQDTKTGERVGIQCSG